MNRINSVVIALLLAVSTSASAAKHGYEVTFTGEQPQKIVIDDMQSDNYVVTSKNYHVNNAMPQGSLTLNADGADLSVHLTWWPGKSSSGAKACHLQKTTVLNRPGDSVPFLCPAAGNGASAYVAAIVKLVH